MKKLSILLLVLAIIFSLCGCEQETTDTAIVTEEETVTMEKPPIVVEEEIQAEETEPSSSTVCRTKTGEKYHRESCIHLKSKIETTVDEARSMGLKPCFVCQPLQ